MRKNAVLMLLVAFSALSYFIISCQHDIPVATQTCEQLHFTVSATPTDVTDNQPNGTITASATGGNGFTYSINSDSSNSTGYFDSLTPGTYTVSASNSQGCTDTAIVTVGGTITIDPCAGVNITVTTTPVNPTTGQSNGSITATASPAGTYTYSLDGGSTFLPSGVFNNLAAGTYTIVAKNGNGCTSPSYPVTIVSTNPCTGVNITVTTTPVNPTGSSNNGSITVTASPAGTYTYSIDGGSYQSSNIFNNLAAGNHTIVVKNNNGCTSNPVTVTLTSSNPCAGVTISVNTTPTNPTNGANGSISVSASGGTSPYTYSLNGGTYGSSSTFSSLSSGSYTVSAKDANGCAVSTPSQVSLACPPIVVSATPRSPNTNCTNGSIVVSATGGVSPYTYSNNGGTFVSSTTFSALGASAYAITAKDSKGCTGTSNVNVAAATTVHFSTDVKPTINSYCGRSNISCHNHSNSWTTYSDIVGTSTGTTWSSNLLTFIRQVRGTTGTTGTCPVTYSSGAHNMPPSNSAAWTTFIQGVFTNWVNQGYPNN